MRPLQLELELITPLFMGGASPNERAELRAPSLKGDLRFWFRTIHPGFRDAEAPIFGSAAGGQSPVALVVPPLQGGEEWPRDPGFRDRHPGLAYLGYTFNLGANRRKSIRPCSGV